MAEKLKVTLHPWRKFEYEGGREGRKESRLVRRGIKIYPVLRFFGPVDGKLLLQTEKGFLHLQQDGEMYRLYEIEYTQEEKKFREELDRLFSAPKSYIPQNGGFKPSRCFQERDFH